MRSKTAMDYYFFISGCITALKDIKKHIDNKELNREQLRLIALELIDDLSKDLDDIDSAWNRVKETAKKHNLGKDIGD